MSKHKFWWWEDAVRFAHERATRTGWRYRIKRKGLHWEVESW